MSARVATLFMGVTLVVTLSAPTAVGYIHFPPMTLPKMCKQSHAIRLLKVEKYDKDKGVIVFAVASTLKEGKSPITSFRHVLRTDADAARTIFDWLEEGETAVMFSIEGGGGGIGYVFIDQYCYSVDYNSSGKYWLMIRGEPGMSACYYGSVERLQEAVKDILDGKEVKVPVKDPNTKEDPAQRREEVNDVLKKNQGSGR